MAPLGERLSVDDNPPGKRGRPKGVKNKGSSGCRVLLTKIWTWFPLASLTKDFRGGRAMSTSFIYHAFGLQGYEYVHQKFEGGSVIIHARPKWRLLRCPQCGCEKVIRRGMCLRKLRSVPIGHKPVWLMIGVPRLKCLGCGCIRRIRLSIAEPRRSYTRAFARYVLALAKVMTLKDIARLLGIGWDCVKDILKRHLASRFSRPKLDKVRYLAIDEISVRKGHKYLTLVMDLDSGAVLFIGEGKGAGALKPFWEVLRRSRAQIQAVSTDMSAAYIGAVLENLPGVALVLDHFHVVKLMNEALTQIRRALHHELQDAMGKQVLKGTRWILLKNPENLSTERDEAAKLQEALQLNAPLATAYYMKEDLRQLWSQVSKKNAQLALDSWIERARASGIAELVRMANTLATYRFAILNWYDHPISSGPMEGTNNKIKVLKRMAYGYRDIEFFKLRIMAIHEAKYSLTG
jgi:transposase